MKNCSRIALKAATLALIGSTMLSTSVTAHTNYKNVEVAFVLDTTGSMSGLIEGAKQKIWSIANEIIDVEGDGQTKVRFALIGYRDRGDAYVAKSFDMTDDIHGIYGHLLDFQAQGGGDRPESVNQALNEAVADLSWSQSSKTLRMVFLVGDAPPHMDYDNEIRYPQIASRASRNNIILNTVQAGSDRETARIWRDIADLGQGDYIAIPQNGGMQMIYTPYDDQIEGLQQRINRTSLGYGSQVEQSAFAGKLSRAMAAPKAVASDMAEYRLKAGKKNQVITGAKELVEDYEDGTLDLDSLAEVDLPDELKGLSTAQKEAKVKTLVAERKELNQQLESLVKKRDAFMDVERKKQAATTGKDAFDTEVRATVERQMKMK
ncbi:MAG: hypothetical protein COA47_08020 [Robiginitomaculum sp.]|nr:MAG: hypothetical protein COA47_08020 [Robiginitomaculum sp.]